MTDGAAQAGAVARMLDTLCPMHAILDQTGHIRHAGPTFRKLSEGRAVDGLRLMELLELRRPRASGSMASLMGLAGKKLHFALRSPPRTELKGVLIPLGEAAGPEWRGGAVLNLSFGISITDAVRDFTLTGADFAATDLAIEMLYLVEAKSAAMEKLRHLNLRLDDARMAAEEQANTDNLTGLRNRHALEPVLTHATGSGAEFALMHLDLDHFKEVNDTHGHAAGDAVLQAVAKRLRRATRDRDTLIRLGGDEFLLVLPDPGGADDVARLARRLVSALERPVGFDRLRIRVSASIGASLSRDYRPVDPDRMMRDADTALYAVKADGRHGFRIYTPDLGDIGGAAGQTRPPG